MPSTLIVGELMHTHDLSSYSFAKGGAAKNSEGFGGRGVMGGGDSALIPGPGDVIDYFNIGTVGNASDFGNLTQARYTPGCVGNGHRGVWAGGSPAPPDPRTDLMDYVTIMSLGNAVDFGGELFSGRSYFIGGAQNGSRGIYAGGSVPADPYTNSMEYINIGVTGHDAKDFGNLTEGRLAPCGESGGGRGIWLGGWEPGNTNIMDWVTIGTADNAADFGDLTEARHAPTSGSNGDRGITIGGQPAQDTIDYFTFGHAANAVDWGEAITHAGYPARVNDGNRSVFTSAYVGPVGAKVNTINYITIGVQSTALDFGDSTQARSSSPGCSGL